MKDIAFSLSSLEQTTRLISYQSINSSNELIVFINAKMLEEIKELKVSFLDVSFIVIDLDINKPKLSQQVKKLCSNTVGEVYLISNSQVKPLKILKSESPLFIEDYFFLCRELNFLGIKEISFFNMNQVLKRRFDYFLDDFVEEDKGRCFIVGNGPSLNKIDMTKLKDEVTFGCNRVYLGFKKWGFNFNYWTVIDRVQAEQHLHEWEQNIPESVIKLIPFEYAGIFNFKNMCPINFLYNVKDFPKFSNNPSKVYLGNTTVYSLMQIAVSMGYKELILVGTDHTYFIPPEKIKSERWTDEKSKNHFHPDYCEGGQRIFVVPRPEKADQAFQHANEWCYENGIEVKNASPGSSLDKFPMVNFEDLF